MIPIVPKTVNQALNCKIATGGTIVPGWVDILGFVLSAADLASTNGKSNAPVVSSASHVFGAADIGNVIQISGGPNWIPGMYSIVSVAGGNATLDHNARR